MTKTKKRTGTLALITTMALLAFTFALSLPSSVLAWDNCPKGLVNDPYPGACRRYVDTNDDGICDLSQSAPTQTTSNSEALNKEQQAVAGTTSATTAASGEPPAGDCPLGDCASCGACLSIGASISDSTVLVDSSDDNASAAALALAAISDSGDGSSGGSSGGSSIFTQYNVSPIAIVFFLVYGISFVLHKTKRIRLAAHRKVWNVLLAATFLITGIFGLILTIQLDYELPFTIPFNLLFWHVEAGVAMTLISLFHMSWHFNYYKNLVRHTRRQVRQVRAPETLRDPEERQLAYQARMRKRAEAEARRTAIRPRGQVSPEV